MEYNKIISPLQTEIAKINAKLAGDLRSDISIITQISQKYQLTSGKKIRAILNLCAEGLFKPTDEKTIMVATAIEQLHLATLLHDDVIDSSTMRRGVKTVNAQFGSKIGVLFGDYIFGKSIGNFAKLENLAVIAEISGCVSVLTAGELLQQELMNQDYDESKYFKIIEMKTSSVFASSMKIGGILGNATLKEINSLSKIGMYFGNAFQIIDDMLDYDLSSSTGKNHGADFFEGKTTLPLILLKTNHNQADSLILSKILSAKNKNNAHLVKVHELMLKYDVLNKTKEVAREGIDKAKELLKIFPANQANKSLHQIADFIVSRGG